MLGQYFTKTDHVENRFPRTHHDLRGSIFRELVKTVGNTALKISRLFEDECVMMIDPDVSC